MSSPLPVAASPDSLRSLAPFFTAAGYTETGLNRAGLREVPWRGSPVRPVLEHKIHDSVLRVLVRLFFFGERVTAQEATSLLTPETLGLLLASSMLKTVGTSFIPTCMLVCFGDMLLACDSVRRTRSNETSDLVLGVNLPTKILARCIVPVQKGDTLDLGTGCGTLALCASAFSESVTATDVNPRALAFAEFNAALNGIPKLSVCLGDRFEPVANRRFDLIVCNPPFFIHPKQRLLYTDNPGELDFFVQDLIRTGPALLKRGGFLQLLCEWVQVGGESWQERLKTWFQASGCDVLVLKTYEIEPADYVLKRAVEASSLHGPSTEQALLDHLGYFKRHKVQKIYGGLVTMRRRSGENWIAYEETEDAPSKPVGKLLLEYFRTQDVLTNPNGQTLLGARPRIPEDVHLVTESTQQDRSWRTERFYIERRSALPKRLAFDPQIAEFIAAFDGTRTVEDAICALSKAQQWPREQAEENCIRLIRKLGSLGLLEFSRN